MGKTHQKCTVLFSYKTEIVLIQQLFNVSLVVIVGIMWVSVPPKSPWVQYPQNHTLNL